MFSIFRNLIRDQVGFPFEIETISLDPNRTYGEQLRESFKLINDVYAHHQDLQIYLDRIEKIGEELLERAPHFDFDPQYPANGYWTMIILLIKFIKATVRPEVQEQIDHDVLVHLFQILDQGLEICRELYQQDALLTENKREATNHNLFQTNLDFIHLLEIVQSMKPQLNSLHEHFNFVWLGSMAKVMQFLTNFMAVYSTQWKSFRFYNWLSRKSRARMFTNMVLNVNVDCLKSMWNLTEFPLVRLLTPSLWQKLSISSRSIYCSSQQRWIIDPKKPIVHDTTKISHRSVEIDNIIKSKANKSIRCLLLQTRNRTKDRNKSLIFHVHGGGFISQSPESHSVYLINWVKKLETIPILSIDYSLSPESVFPEALQEVLDCYLWILSKKPDVEEKLGFRPEKIVICGDSAGGNFTMALMEVLNIIQKQITADGGDCWPYRYPDGLFLFYAPFTLSTKMVSPSRILTSIDGLVPLGTLLNCLGAYLPDELISNESKLSEKNQTIVLADSPDTFVRQSFKTLVPSNENLRHCLEQMNMFLENPFISPLMLEKIEFNHIPLYLYPLTFDAFLDDSIEMAKKWRPDKVQIYSIDEVPHGFLNLVDFDHKARIASYHCIDHIFDILS
ncbi:Hormone-sensitive lipase [Sarcoptes scabiei]|uniref:Hormone-sensitive lipase n=1 Tax=Sarcoptes scabiei TaxID=52283 RepID=A0A834VEQ7_SARSC|nr:Hormone-sensitive lipase [Sarcoptes scabiei]